MTIKPHLGVTMAHLQSKPMRLPDPGLISSQICEHSVHGTSVLHGDFGFDARGGGPERWPGEVARRGGPERRPGEAARGGGPGMWPGEVARGGGPGRWPGEVARWVLLVGCDPGMLCCLQWQTYRSCHRAKLESCRPH